MTLAFFLFFMKQLILSAFAALVLGTLSFSSRFQYFKQATRKVSSFATTDDILHAVRRAAKNMESSDISDSSEIITRAVLAYLPDQKKFRDEFKFHYLSIGVMRSNQETHVKTDMVIYADAPSFPFLQALGCVFETRKSRDEAEKCVIYTYIPAAFEDPLLAYSYFPSIYALAQFSDFSLYTYTIRVDLDTFLTPGFASWLPDRDKIFVGSGGYGSTNANNHLKWISKELNLNFSDLQGLGSTWYGSSSLMVKTAELTVAVMRWIYINEFTKYEKCCSGTDGWPHWHAPVVLLYAGHVALNHLGKVKMSHEGEFMMDYGSDNSAALSLNVKHIHCWHSDKRFSKFGFESGLYKDLDLSEFVNMTSSRDYATLIAVTSTRLSDQEYRLLLQNQKNFKSTAWYKLT